MDDVNFSRLNKDNLEIKKMLPCGNTSMFLG
jgi:hypothetical protein